MSASRAARARTAERRRQCLQLRIAGATWDRIAEQLDYASRAAACKDFLRAMEATQAAVTENATLLRQLELARLDAVQRAFWPDAINHADHRAGKVLLDVHDRRVRLLGLDNASRTMDNAVDAWIAAVTAGDPTGGGAGLEPGDDEALASVLAA